ncbi:hypothetical protein HDU98_005273, partial [Podochytrium sp. JEL0797]
MYEGRYVLDCEHASREETTTILNAHDREYKLHQSALTSVGATHAVPGNIVNATYVSYVQGKEKTSERLVDSLLLMDGADCYGMYGWASEINDFRKDPFSGKEEEDTSNCAIIDIAVCGWPVFFLLATKKISKGAEVFLDYGETYWPVIEPLHEDEHYISTILKPLDDLIPKIYAALPTLIKSYEFLIIAMTSCHSNLVTHFATQTLSPERRQRVDAVIARVLESRSKVKVFVGTFKQILQNRDETRIALLNEKFPSGCRRRGVLTPARLVMEYLVDQPAKFEIWVSMVEKLGRLADSIMSGGKAGYAKVAKVEKEALQAGIEADRTIRKLAEGARVLKEKWRAVETRATVTSNVCLLRPPRIAAPPCLVACESGGDIFETEGGVPSEFADSDSEASDFSVIDTRELGLRRFGDVAASEDEEEEELESGFVVAPVESPAIVSEPMRVVDENSIALGRVFEGGSKETGGEKNAASGVVATPIERLAVPAPRDEIFEGGSPLKVKLTPPPSSSSLTLSPISAVKEADSVNDEKLKVVL